MKLTFIGNGIMAEAMISGLLKNNYEIEVFGRDEKKLENLNKNFNNSLEVSLLNHNINISGKIVILCIKPYALKDVSRYFVGEAKLLLSVLARTSLLELKESIDSQNYVRAMPNLAARFGKSMTTLIGDKALQQETTKIFSSIGKNLWVESEKEFDTASILAGSSPAFLALVAEALIDGAVKEGLKRDDATYLAKGAFEGFYQLFENSIHPAFIKDAVMSPGGITAKGYATLEENGVRAAFIKAMQN